jgi:hypothetical protein
MWEVLSSVSLLAKYANDIVDSALSMTGWLGSGSRTCNVVIILEQLNVEFCL